MPESDDKLLEIDIPTINFFPKNHVARVKLHTVFLIAPSPI